MPDRLVELESKVAMLEHTVDALSGELAAHQRTIDRLQANVAALVQQLKRQRGEAADAGEPIEPHDTPPPHWGGRS
ncbi:MAG: SlyX family protein [Planctomycetes bacterium]|nr:SlyX family protein [Planctomycetota bacterium]